MHCALLILDIDPKAADDTAAKILYPATNPEIRAKTLQLDIAIEGDVKKAVAYTVGKFGRIDCCAASAGVSRFVFYTSTAAVRAP